MPCWTLTKEIQNTTRVAPFIIVPGNQLDEMVVQSNTGLGIKDGRMVVTIQIAGNQLILGIGNDTFNSQLSLIMSVS